MKKRSSKREPEAKEIKKDTPGVCAICCRSRVVKQDENDPEPNILESFGGYFQTEKNTFYHYFCALFSQGIKQNGAEDEGVHGFLSKDLQKLTSDTKYNQCCHCERGKATVKCAESGCKKWYHYPCGVDNDAIFIFSGKNAPKSFCSRHIPRQRTILRHEKICLICHEDTKAAERTFISPCCQRIWHMNCVQNMGLTYGRAHFKCPMCKDNESFAHEAEKFGLYIPEKDADWELPENEDFYGNQAMGALYAKCDAQRCACTKGPKHNLVGSRFEIIRCSNCGQGGVHIFCGNLMRKAPYFICPDHEGAQAEMKAKKKELLEKMRKENINEDDYDELNDAHLIKKGFQVRPSTSKSAKRGPKPGPKSRVNQKRKLSSPPKKKKVQQPPIKKRRPNIEEVLLDSSSSEDEETSVSSRVKVPFKLQNPVTKESTVMPVGPLQFDFELSPSLEGLNLQIQENLRGRRRPPPPPSTDDETTDDTLPKISAGFTLRGIVDHDEIFGQQQRGDDHTTNEFVDLCDDSD